MRQVLLTPIIKISKTFHLKFLNIFTFVLLLGSQIFCNTAFAEMPHSNICSSCHENSNSSLVYPIILSQEDFNSEKMLLVGKTDIVCPHMFCENCVHSDIDLAFYHRCPLCFKSFYDLIPIDDKIDSISEKSLTNLKADKLIKIIDELVNQELLDKALIVAKLIPDKEHVYYHDDNNPSYWWSATNCYFFTRNYIYLSIAEEYATKENLAKASEILDLISENLTEIEDIDLVDDTELIDFLLQLSLVYANVKNSNKSLEILNRVLEKFNFIEDEQYQNSDYYLLTAKIYKKIKNLDKSLEFLDKSLLITKKIKEPLYLSFCLSDITIEYIELGKINQALDILNTTAELAESITNDDWDKQQVYLNTLDGYIKAHKINQAINMLAKALAANSYFLEEEQHSFVIKFNNYVNSQQFEQAFKIFSKSIDLIESILNLEEGYERKKTLFKMLEEGDIYFQTIS